MPRAARCDSTSSKCVSSSRASRASGASIACRSGYLKSRLSAVEAAFFSQCAWSIRTSSRSATARSTQAGSVAEARDSMAARADHRMRTAGATTEAASAAVRSAGGLLFLGDPHEREEARDVVAADARQVTLLGEVPEGRAGRAAERPIDTPLAAVVGGERQRPVLVAIVEVAQVADRGFGRALRVHAVVALLVDDQTEAARRPRPELPEPVRALPAAGARREAALDGGEQRDVL